MTRKRQFQSVDFPCIDDDDDGNDFEVDGNLNGDSEEDSDGNTDPSLEVLSEDDKSSDSEGIESALYLKYLKERKKFKKLKAKISYSVNHKTKKSKNDMKQKDAFTRFSVTYFSAIISAMSPARKTVIEQYGFGSLLKFQKCTVPNKFAQWVARQIDYKTGDIVVKPSIIPFTRESVHYVLDVPLGSIPFPKDFSIGKSKLLSKFNLLSMPKVKFFGQKLVNEDETLSDEEVFTCFILVALNCFLCPNSSLYPASKYLGIFENLENVKNFDWAQFILDWSLQAVRTFNVGKSNKTHEPPALGGCLYLLAVYYLDFVDFGHRQVAPGLPRILYWKDSMIKDYSDLDEISPGIFGFRPVMNISRTCYSKQAIFLQKNPSTLALDSDFLEKLDHNSRCILPTDLKKAICDLLDEHSIKSALNFNFQITSIATLSDDMKKTFATLMEHAYSVDLRAQKMVLKLLKILTEYEPKEPTEKDNDNDSTQHLSAHNICTTPKADNDAVQYDGAQYSHNSQFQRTECPNHPEHTETMQNGTSSANDMDQHQNSAIKTPVNRQCTPPSVRKSCLKRSSSDAIRDNSSIFPNEHTAAMNSSSKVPNAETQKVMQKLTKQDNVPIEITTPHSKPSDQFTKPSDQSTKCKEALLPAVNNKRQSKSHLINNFVSDSEIGKFRDPLYDINDNFEEVSLPTKKSVTFVRDNGEKDVIYLDNEEEYVPDFATPPSAKRASKYVFQKKSPIELVDEDNCTQQTPMTMISLDDSPTSNGQVTPLLSQPKFGTYLQPPPSKPNMLPPNQNKDSPECQITGGTNVFHKASEMNKKAELIYNATLKFAQPSCSKFVHESAKKEFASPQDLSFSQVEGRKSAFQSRLSSTGGKMPHYGPRRPIYPTITQPNHVSNGRSRFRVSESEMKNYRAILNLGESEFQGEFAVDIGSVRCTYRSLRDSLKPDGFVNNFVVNVFCRHLFMKANGHPDVSKKHYFFSTIGDNFLKHPDDASQDVLRRAFTRSKKARPLPESNLLFFPTLFENHWFVFVVDIKDNYFVFLDPFYKKDDDYQQHVRQRMIPSFQLHWDKYVPGDRDMKFDKYRVIYPVVPRQTEDNLVDSGIIVMMILEHWNSPRAVLTSIFDLNDIPNIRVKIANELMFLPSNNGSKRRVIEYFDQKMKTRFQDQHAEEVKNKTCNRLS
ncbi:hypothetical protein ACP70R_004385 [Stipagrostis hirtigluma subsp. patula]